MKDLTRRQVLEGAALAGGAAALAAHAPLAQGMAVLGRNRRFAEYRRHDAVGLAKLVEKGDASPLELLDIAIARAEEMNPRIHAIVLEHFELAREAVRAGLPDGPFRGVPFLLKDLGVQMGGTVTTHGSRFFRDARAESDDTFVHRAKKAGLVIFGKTMSPEFGTSPSTETRLFGAVRNPWNLERSAAGSSGGSAAAVAAGILPAAHASDGGGSIRMPASACGLVGLKPTRGRVPLGPAQYEGRNGLAAQHVVSRSVRDTAALLDSFAGPDAGDPYGYPAQAGPYTEAVRRDPGALRIAWIRTPPLPLPVDEDCLAAAEKAAKQCEALGHRVEEATLPVDTMRMFEVGGISGAILVAEKVAAREKQLGRAVGPDDLEPVNAEILAGAKQITAMQYSEARRDMHQASRRMAEFLYDYDVILSPTMGFVPQKIGVLRLDQPLEAFSRPATQAALYTSLYNTTGQPAISLPLHWTDDGLPVGVMFAGRFGDEATLLRLAAQLERAHPWFGRVPPL